MNTTTIKGVNTFGLLFLIGMNMLAVLLPLGGRTTGELSALYPNLFVPAGFTFAIWSVIYVLLIIFTTYLWVGDKGDKVTDTLGFWFIANALANGFWLVFWHYEFVFISIIIMLFMLYTLMVMYQKLDISYFSDSPTPWQARVPVSVYLGWISVATIANMTVVFVHLGYQDLGLGADTWATIVLLVAVGLALTMLYRFKDIFFAAVVCWASFGIYSKRSADTVMLDNRIEHTSYISIYILIIAILLAIVLGLIKKK